MNQTAKHTEPPPNSQAAAFGYKAYGGSVSVTWYSSSSKTGYAYFGARYLDAELSLWLSVDPMADKYPSMSPFMYTAGNPVMLVDPDGRKFKDAFGHRVKVRVKKDGTIKYKFSKKTPEIGREYFGVMDKKEAIFEFN